MWIRVIACRRGWNPQRSTPDRATLAAEKTQGRIRSAVNTAFPGARNLAGLILTMALCLGSSSAAQRSLDPNSGTQHPAASAPARSKEAYVVFIRERTRDASELKTYSAKAPASLVGQPVTLLAAYGRQEVLEGAQMEGVVIVRFPSFDAAKAWYDGPEYREARKHRFNGADYRAVIVEGVE